MSKVVYKYLLTEHVVKMPKGAKILTIQCQGTTPCIWALIDSNAGGEEERSFVTYATGETINNTGLEYIGTFQLYQGKLIYHVFEKLKS